MKNQKHENRSAADILKTIRSIQSECGELREDDRPNAEPDIAAFAADVAEGRRRTEIRLSDFHRTGRILENGGDDLKSVADFLCWIDGDKLVQRFSEWRRGEGAGGMAPQLRHKRIAELEQAEREEWRALLAVVDQLEDLPADFPPEIYLEFEAGRVKALDRFRRLQNMAGQSRVAGLEFDKTLLAIDKKLTSLQNQRLMHGPTSTREDVERIEREIADLSGSKLQLAKQRNVEQEKIKGSLALFANCSQFLRSQGIDIESADFRLYGRAEAIHITKESPMDAALRKQPPAHATRI